MAPRRNRLYRNAIAAVAIALVSLPAIARADEPVTIVRDSHDEPHVRAQSAQGALYGFAYAQMQDQADFLLTFIDQANGRSARYLGPACLPGCFNQDQTSHLLRIPESANEKYDTLPAESRTRYEAFANGINAFIADHPDLVPEWAHPVTGPDVLASAEWRFVLAQAGHAQDLLSAGGAAAASVRTAQAEEGSTYGDVIAAESRKLSLGISNGFALAGSKTATGKSIVQGDPHLPFTGQTQWYVGQLSYPGTRVEGATFRGLPGIAMGTNGNVAWTHTSNQTTLHEQDLYQETLNPSNPDQYLFDGNYRDMDVQTVPIDVQTAPGVLSTVPVRFRYTMHGPVTSDPLAHADGTQADPPTDFAYAAKLSQFEEVGLMTQMWAEGEARSLAEFKQAMEADQLSQYNTIAADADNIFFAATGRSGVINQGFNYNQPLDGSNPATNWQGILPFDEIPQAENPPSGYYQNANNSAATSAPGQINDADLPWFLQGGGQGTRSRRLVDILGPASNLTLQQVEGIGMDNYLEFAPSLVGLLDQTAADPGADPKVQEAATAFDTWDLHADSVSTEYPLFATWRRGLDPDALGFDPTNPPPATTTFTSAQKAEASRALIVAYDGMTAQYGSPWKTYGDLHTLTWGSFTAPVNGGDNDLGTLRLTSCRASANATSPIYYHPCAVVNGSSFMMNADLSSDLFTVSSPVSDSDDPSSAHFTDNAQDYAADRYRVFPVTDAQTDAEETSRTDLVMPVAAPPGGGEPPAPGPQGATGKRAHAIKKCKRIKKKDRKHKRARHKCMKRAKRLPV